MNRNGQMVDRSMSGGMGVQAYWAMLFARNETAHAEGRHADVLTDGQLTRAMQEAFPARAAYPVMRRVQTVRSAYNNGRLTGDEIPNPRSHRYIRRGRGVEQVESKLRKTRTLGVAPADKTG